MKENTMTARPAKQLSARDRRRYEDLKRAREEQYKSALSRLSPLLLSVFLLSILLLALFFCDLSYIHNTDVGREVSVSFWSYALATVSGSFSSPAAVFGDIAVPFYYYAETGTILTGILSLLTILAALALIVLSAILFAKRKYDLAKTDEKREYVTEALSIVREAESAAEREELLKRVARETQISVGALQRDLENAPVIPRSAEPVRPKEDDAGRDKKAARFVLAACLLSKPYAAAFDLSSVEFDDPAHRTIAMYVISGRKTGQVRASGIFDLMPADGELAEILNLDYGDNLDSPAAEKYFSDCVRTLRARSLSEKIDAERKRYFDADEEEKRKILAKIMEYTTQLKSLSGGKE